MIPAIPHMAVSGGAAARHVLWFRCRIDATEREKGLGRHGGYLWSAEVHQTLARNVPAAVTCADSSWKSVLER